MNGPGIKSFLNLASENEQEARVHYVQFITFLERIDSLFREITVGEFQGEPIAALIFMNAHASFLGASRLALSGQSAPTYMVMRGALESALYALIASHTDGYSKIWVNRSKDIAACRRVFTAKNAFTILERDPHLCAAAKQAYEASIDFGAHPNFRSVFDHIGVTELNDVTFTYLHSVPSNHIERAVTACIETSLIILNIAVHAFPKHAPAKLVHSESVKVRKEFENFLIDEGHAPANYFEVTSHN